jgi:3-oxoacyl-[acyl-carrier protein] reductase
MRAHADSREEQAMEESGVEGQVAIVTGAGSGIGRAVCARLAGDGARVVAVDIDGRSVDETVGALADRQGSADSPGMVEGMVLDARREEDMETMARRTLERWGRIDCLIACAGILRPRGSAPSPLAQMALAEWDEVIDTNLRGTFLSNRAVLPTMIQQRSGHIVNLSSTAGRQGRAFDSAYCASKFGVIGLSEAAAQEVSRYGVKIHVVLPDAVDTPLWEQNGPLPAPPDRLPPERVADLILFLLNLPGDTVLVEPVVAPFRVRRRGAEPQTGGGR